MPPALVLLGLVAVAVPAAAHALFGRPRLVIAAVVASAVAVVVAQVAGELARINVAVVGDAQLGAAIVASVFGTALIALAEPSSKRLRARG